MSSKNFKEFRSQTEEANRELREYCEANGIKNINNKEFWFSLNGKTYRVSRYRAKLTDKDTKSLPWIDVTKVNVVSIKIRNQYNVIDVYEALKEGKDLRSIKLKKRISNQVSEEEVATPVAKPEEKPIIQNRTATKKQSALNSLLGKRR